MPILVSIVALLAICALAAVARALPRAKISRVAACPAPALPDGAVARFQAALRIETVSRDDRSKVDGGAFERFHAFLEESFPLVHERLKREVVGGCSLVFEWAGSDRSIKPMMLLSHIDVVPAASAANSDWTHPPFGGVLDDGFVWGRGALDTKCTLMGALESVEALLKAGFAPKRTVMLAFGHDEEVGGANGAGKIVELLRERGTELEYVLDEGGAVMSGGLFGIGPAVAAVGVAEKGMMSLELTARGESGHAAMPPSKSAAGSLCAAVLKIEKNPFPARLTRPVRDLLQAVADHMCFRKRLILKNLWLFSPVVKKQLAKTPITNALIRSTAAVTVLEAGEKANTVSATARAVVNLRILTGDTANEAVERIRRLAGRDVEVRVLADQGRSEPTQCAGGRPAGLEEIRRTVDEIFPGAIVVESLLGGATDSRLYAPLTGNIFKFAPIRLEPEDLSLIHGANERISVENYGLAVGFFKSLIERSAGY